MVIWLIPLIVALLAALAEWLHARRTRRMAFLAFGPAAKPRRWVRLIPPARIVALTALAWGLLVLWQIDGSSWLPSGQQERADKNIHHLILALDVSPSMQIKDAGPQGDQTRAERARDILRSILQRINQQQTRVSVIAFYGESRPVTIDTIDAEVVDNILDDLPLEHAFKAGKTDMYQGVKTAAEIARTWRPNSTTFVMASDGDTLPATTPPTLPAAVSNTLIVGVGNPHRGTPIDGHSSRQDTQSLRRLALQLRGIYSDGNVRHIRTADLQQFVVSMPTQSNRRLELRDGAILAIIFGAAVLTFVSPLLAAAGAAAADRQHKTPATVRSP